MQDVAVEFVDDERERAVSAIRRSCSFAHSRSVRRIAELHRCRRPAEPQAARSPGRRAAAGRPARLRRDRCASGDQRVRTPGASAVPTVRIRARRSRICRACATKDLERRGWRRLPAHSIVYYLLVDRDGAGENFHPLDYLDRVTAVGQRPGLLLGRLGDGPWHRRRQPQGVRRPRSRPSAGLALRVLRGEPADSIPVSAPDLNVNVRSTGASCGAGASAKRACRRERSSGSESRRSGTATRSTFSARSALMLAQTALIAGLLVQTDETATGRGASARKPGGAAHELRADPRSRRRGC